MWISTFCCSTTKSTASPRDSTRPPRASEPPARRARAALWTRRCGPGAFAVGAGATFIARGIDIDQKGLPGILTDARAHRGSAFVEILQNCIVYNKDIFESVSNRKTAADHQLRVQHGQPLLYGPNQDKGLRLNPKTLQLEAIQVGAGGVDEVLVHDETNQALALMLLNLAPPLPTAIGVIHRRQAEPFSQAFWNNKTRERRQRVVTLLHQGNLVDHRE